jgi:hypothetical protein
MVIKIQLARLSCGKHLIKLKVNAGRSEKSGTTIHTYIYIYSPEGGGIGWRKVIDKRLQVGNLELMKTTNLDEMEATADRSTDQLRVSRL